MFYHFKDTPKEQNSREWRAHGRILFSVLANSRQAFDYAHDHGELSNSQKQAVITLLEKKGKDKTLIKNWRPISLINVDAKIASKT